MIKPYFIDNEGFPSPLETTVERKVRFEEVDMLGIVWHGRYVSYFEDARVALGEKFGVGYLDFYRNGILAPIKRQHVDHFHPLRFGDRVRIKAILHWSEAVRINYEFVVSDTAGKLYATGYTIQMLLDRELNILIAPPPFWETFRSRWRSGEFEC